MNKRIKKLYNKAMQKGVEALLITSNTSIKYLTGYFYNFETGASPFQLIPAALWIDRNGQCSLIIADNETGNFANSDKTFTLMPYLSYTYTKPLDFINRFLWQLHDTVKQSGGNIRNIGVEAGSVPWLVVQSLQIAYPGLNLIDITDELKQMRMVKDPDELEDIRKAVHLCDVGQQVVSCARPGMSELELFNLIRREIENEAGQRVPIMADLVCGDRTLDGGGNPSTRAIQKGDLILSDLTPCLNGYWGDTCNTTVIGEPTADQQNDFSLIKETLSRVIDEIKPGIPANHIDQMLRSRLSAIAEYNHHSGHGIGLENHEEPRITPYNEIILKPNMVIALEPAIYRNNYGIRLEHVIAVTSSGCEIISQFEHNF